MPWTEIIGFVAGICTTVAVIPQIVKAWRTRKVKDISPSMFAVLFCGVTLWVVYGILQKDWPIIAANGISLSLNGLMLYMMLLFKEKGEPKKTEGNYDGRNNTSK